MSEPAKKILNQIEEISRNALASGWFEKPGASAQRLIR
jgi:hypothetical protein